MKKFFLSALLVSCVGLVFISCNNGAYDANPTTNNSNIPNPLLNNGGNVALGNITAKVNGTSKTWSGFAKDSLDLFMIGGSTTALPYEFLQFVIPFYEGSGKQYHINDTASSGIFQYGKYDGATLKAYQLTIGLDGHMTIEITEDANNKVRGKFNGVVYNTTVGSPDPNDSLVITEGEFYINKQ